MLTERECINRADLPAGEYVLLPASEFSAYYEVNSSSTGEVEDIIDNDNFDGRRYLTVEDGQYLTIQRCMMVPLDKAPKVDISSGVVPEGMYRVGVDIPAGNISSAITLNTTVIMR